MIDDYTNAPEGSVIAELMQEANNSKVKSLVQDLLARKFEFDAESTEDGTHAKIELTFADLLVWQEVEKLAQKELDKPENAGKAVKDLPREIIDCLEAEAERIIGIVNQEKETPANFNLSLFGKGKQNIPSIFIRGDNEYAKKIDNPHNKETQYYFEGKPLEVLAGTQEFGIEKKDSKKEVTVCVTLDYYTEALDDLEEKGYKFPRAITPFDKRVYCAVAELSKNAETVFVPNIGSNDIKTGKVMTATQIYKTLHCNSKARPNSNQINAILSSILKLSCLKISIDNSNEVAAYKESVPFCSDVMSFLNCNIGKVNVNGKLSEKGIFLFEYPPLIALALARKQITSIPAYVLDAPVKDTYESLALQNFFCDYLPALNSNPQLSRKISFARLYEKCGINGSNNRKEKLRCRETAATILEHYKKTGFIKDFKQLDDGFKVSI